MLLGGRKFLPDDFHQTPQKEACGFVGRPANTTRQTVIMLIIAKSQSKSVNKPKIEMANKQIR